MKTHGQELKTMTSFKMRGASILTRERRISSPFGGLTAQSLWVLPFGERSAPPAQPLAVLFPLRKRQKQRSRCSRHKGILCVVFASLRSHKSKTTSLRSDKGVVTDAWRRSARTKADESDAQEHPL